MSYENNPAQGELDCYNHAARVKPSDPSRVLPVLCFTRVWRHWDRPDKAISLAGLLIGEEDIFLEKGTRTVPPRALDQGHTAELERRPEPANTAHQGDCEHPPEPAELPRPEGRADGRDR